MDSPEDTGDNRYNAAAMFGPDRFAPRLHDVPHEELEAAGIRGLIVDLDNTLLGFRETELAQRAYRLGRAGARPRFSDRDALEQLYRSA